MKDKVKQETKKTGLMMKTFPIYYFEFILLMQQKKETSQENQNNKSWK